jgi:AmmeMemoRadiSam system protein A
MDIPRRQSPWRFLLAVIAVAVVWYVFIRPGTETLDAPEKAELLRLSREQLAATAAGHGMIEIDETELPPRLLLPGSAFVSLSEDGELRGCMIDIFEEHEPLYRNVLRNTVLAARDDERFPPVMPEEVDELRIAISVLTTPEPVEFEDPEELIEKLAAGLDGVILTADGSMATYLPEVWETFPDHEAFLSHLCEKATLPSDRWRQEPYPTIETYRVVTFEEG